MATSAALLTAIGLSRDAAVSASRLYRIVRKRKRETRRLRVFKSGRADHKPLADPRPHLAQPSYAATGS